VWYTTRMKTTVFRYNVLIKKEGKDYIAHVPSLDISDFGKSVEEAQKHVRQAIAIHLEGLIKTGSEVPSPQLVL